MSSVKFYAGIPCESYKYTAEQLTKTLIEDSACLDRLCSDQNFMEVALPDRSTMERNRTIEPLRTDTDMARRYLTLVLCLLRRLGFKCICPVVPVEFTIVEELDDNTSVTLHSFLSNKFKNEKYNALLERVIGSLTVLGYPDIAAYLYDCAFLIASRAADCNVVGRPWIEKVRRQLAEDYKFIADSEMEVRTPLRKELIEISLTRESIDAKWRLPAAKVSNVPVPFCKHNVYLKAHFDDKIQKRQLACFIKECYPECKWACDVTAPL